jgi:hypothetical protein
MGNYGAPDVNSHVPSAALPPHLYLSRLRPSDRESVPLRPLATDYSLLATTVVWVSFVGFANGLAALN